jgi:hypothetical protein
MIRLVEILVAINALAGIAGFLGLRYAIRKAFFRRLRKVPPERALPSEERSGLAQDEPALELPHRRPKGSGA